MKDVNRRRKAMLHKFFRICLQHNILLTEASVFFCMLKNKKCIHDIHNGILNSLWLLLDLIVQHHNPGDSIRLTDPIGTDPDFTGFLTNGFQTKLPRKRSDRFLSHLLVRYCCDRQDLLTEKTHDIVGFGRNLVELISISQ